MFVTKPRPVLYVTTLVLGLITHFVLCFPAATSRGYLSISPFQEHVAIYLVFLVPAIAPLFHNFADSEKQRICTLCCFSVFAAILTGVARANVASATPRTGSLGYFEVWRHHPLFIVVKSIEVCCVAVPFVLCLESISRTAWDCVRSFAEESAVETEALPSDPDRPYATGHQPPV